MDDLIKLDKENSTKTSLSTIRIDGSEDYLKNSLQKFHKTFHKTSNQIKTI